MANATAVNKSIISSMIAEAFGTFLLVFSVVATAVFTGDAFKVAIAVGFAVFVGIAAVGHISGGHFNPAVTIGLALAGRFPWGRTWQYAIAQVLGAIVASSIVFLIATGGQDGFARQAAEAGFASNGFGEHSPGGFGLIAVIITEVVLTAVFLYVILGVTDLRNVNVLAPLAIGLTLAAIHLVAIPISNAGINPARSIATAIFGGPDALGQLIVFILAPLLGAAIAGLSYKPLFAREA